MAIVTERFCSLDDPATTATPDFQFFVTYDDTDMLARSVRIQNNGTTPVQIRVYNPDGTLRISYVAQPGENTTYNIPRNQRPNSGQPLLLR